MPSMATLTINDYAAAAKNYTVLGIRDNVASWVETSQGTVAGNLTITGEVRFPADPSTQVTKVIWNLARPHVNSTTGLVDRVLRAKIELYEPAGALLAERQELFAMVKNVAAHTFFQSSVIDQQGMY